MSESRRILHVVGAMNRGGIETWLMHVLRCIDRERFRMDFLVHTRRPGDYDAELESLGARILPCPYAHQPLAYAREFRRIVRENGPYDVIHSHVHHFNGFVLRLAESAGIPQRIAHSHNDPSSADAARGILRQGYAWISGRWIRAYATDGAGCSRRAAESLFGAEWQRDGRWRVLSYSIDLAAFGAGSDRVSVRAELGIPADAFVIGHTGRFVDQKNHAFLLKIARELVRLEPRTRVVLVGDGPLRPAIAEMADAYGIRGAVDFLGVRRDVARLMMGAMDLFVFPSHFEGLGLVVVEAQAAGLPCLISRRVPEEADIVPGLIHRLSVDDPPEEWAQTALAIRAQPRSISQEDALAAVRASSFNIAQGVRAVEEIYAG